MRRGAAFFLHVTGSMKKLVMLLLVVVMVAWGCSTAPYTGRKQLSLIPAAQLDSLGLQAFNQLLQQAPTTTDPEITNYIKCVTDPVVEAVARTHKDAPKEWRLAVIRDGTPNAFALPGGNIGVHVGMLKVAKTDEQLAAVIGHELGHVLANHSGERISQATLAQTGLAITQGVFLGDMSPQAQQLTMAALGLGAQVGVLLPFGRTQEAEADIIGINLMARAGFHPGQAIDLWQNMIAATQGQGAPPQFLSTHPSPEARIDRIRTALPTVMADFEAAQKNEGRGIASEKCKRPSDAKIEAESQVSSGMMKFPSEPGK